MCNNVHIYIYSACTCRQYHIYIYILVCTRAYTCTEQGRSRAQGIRVGVHADITSQGDFDCHLERCSEYPSRGAQGYNIQWRQPRPQLQTNERMHQRTNARTRDPTDARTHERKNARTHVSTNPRVHVYARSKVVLERRVSE